MIQNAFAREPAGSHSRREEARRITELLESNPSFSFLRLGDGELRFLLLSTHNQWSDQTLGDKSFSPSCENAIGMLGLSSKDYDRLVNSYRYCSYLDTYGYQPYNSQHLAKLELDRPETLYQSHSIATSGIIPDWTWFELPSYLKRHRCLFYGAEAGLLEQLLREPAYREIWKDFWSNESTCWFHVPPNDGRELSKNLDIVKAELIDLIKTHKVDTLFLSLGGAAKILSYELAEELEIRAIDWGSLMRGLTYSGSDGQSSWRSSHHVFLKRVPLSVFFPAMLRAYPDLSLAQTLGKAHAQLCLELQKKVLIESVPSDIHDLSSYDPSRENLEAFLESYQYYKQQILPLAHDSASKAVVSEFKYWMLKKGLGFQGRIFRGFVNTKQYIRQYYPNI